MDRVWELSETLSMDRVWELSETLSMNRVWELSETLSPMYLVSSPSAILLHKTILS
ncbi:hypothetical protein M5D10_03215 [Leptospira santarosai]|uniref:hypothetical protein n=1 Tax=Leptospira santarosai TaxID=28183 RepID=UPI0022A95499|nr:hypothetical protein [Leptospira santarosai]UZN08002.1 hypothetical protein M5D10_03215 [Leptospira santarosai]